jgi:hypothetical protein
VFVSLHHPLITTVFVLPSSPAYYHCIVSTHHSHPALKGFTIVSDGNKPSFASALRCNFVRSLPDYSYLAGLYPAGLYPYLAGLYPYLAGLYILTWPDDILTWPDYILTLYCTVSILCRTISLLGRTISLLGRTISLFGRTISLLCTVLYPYFAALTLL